MSGRAQIHVTLTHWHFCGQPVSRIRQRAHPLWRVRARRLIGEVQIHNEQATLDPQIRAFYGVEHIAPAAVTTRPRVAHGEEQTAAVSLQGPHIEGAQAIEGDSSRSFKDHIPVITSRDRAPRRLGWLYLNDEAVGRVIVSDVCAGILITNFNWHR